MFIFCVLCEIILGSVFEVRTNGFCKHCILKMVQFESRMANAD